MIADAAHQRGISVLVDGAHSFAHFEYAIPDLGADYSEPVCTSGLPPVSGRACCMSKRKDSDFVSLVCRAGCEGG